MTTSAPTTSWAQKAAAAGAAAAAGNAPSSSAAADASSAAATDARAKFDSRSYVVLDTNALLLSGNGGTGLARYAKSDNGSESPALLVTTRAALAEVRDTASREALERTRGAGVCDLSLREPDEEDIKAVLAFARETGELHSISSTDARLIALARGLERAAGRGDRLRLGPPPPRAVRRGGPGARPPPGWGACGGDWAPLDALEEEEEEKRAARASGVGEKKKEEGEEGGEGEEEAVAAAAAAAAPPTPEQQQKASDGGAENSNDGDGDDDDDDDGWTTAAKSSAAQRRSRRTAARRAVREAAAAAAAAAAAPAAAEEEEEEEGWETASEISNDEEEGDESVAPSSTTTAAGKEEKEQQEPAADSPISLVTSDFAMQNVALQMGLKVVSPDPNSQRQLRQIREARRWALRCSACSFCSREAGRLFCPRCGNAALDKVEVVVDFASGAAAFGVRKSHCLRGTKFSLPKPRGGRGGSGPILREDQFLEAMARAKRSNRGRKGATMAATAGGGGSDDPLLAPELATADIWFKAAGGGSNGGGLSSATASLGGATAALVAATWKHNPNEARRWGGGVRASGSAGKRK